MAETTDKELMTYLGRAAEGAISQDEFQGFFTPWRLETKHRLIDIIIEVVDLHWGALNARNIFFIPFPAPKNILQQNRDKLRILVKAIEEGWDEERTEREVDEA